MLRLPECDRRPIAGRLRPGGASPISVFDDSQRHESDIVSTPPNSTWVASRTSRTTASALRFGREDWLKSCLLLIALFVAIASLSARSWGTWPDPLIDFGRELYVPWRMAEGDVLYRDVAYFNGPLSPTFNAALFRLLGASLQTLVAANFVLLVILAFVLHRTLRRVSSSGVANVGVGALLALFAFSQFLPVRNYNYICPYSHEMTHGLLLSLLALVTIWRVGSTGAWTPFFAGVLLGLVALTKVELTIAACAGVVVSAVLLARLEAKPWRKLVQWGALLTLGATIPLGIAVAWLAQWMSIAEAVGHCLGAWAMAGSEEIRRLDFYRRGMGTFDLAASIHMIAGSTSRWILLIAAGALASRLAETARNRFALGATGVLAALALWFCRFSWASMERALPVLMAGVIVWRFGRYLSARNGTTTRQTLAESDDSRAPEDQPRREAFRVGWCVFALAMLAKMLLNSRIAHYGFVLAVPATMTVMALLYDWLPQSLAGRGKWGSALPWLATPLLLAYVAAYQLEQTRLTTSDRSFGQGADQFTVGDEAAPMIAALDQIEQRVAQDETLAVLPEGVMLNYLARRRVSVPYITWMPPEVLHFGEAEMLAQLAAARPDWVILADRDLTEYGVPPFGAGYADGIAGWIDANYLVVETWDGGRWRLLQWSGAREAPHVARANRSSP